MKIKEIAEFIIDHFSRSDREWFNDCLLLALEEYGFDEVDAFEQIKKIEKLVKNCLRSHMDDCKRRGIPPIIKLTNDEVIGRQRPEVMVKLQETIKSVDPYEFQRLCCLYVQGARGYSVQAVNRRDKGADIIAKQRDVSFVAQARRHIEKNVGKSELEQWVVKVGQHYRGAAFIFISATLYTYPAREYADQVFVTLIDGEQIAYFLYKKSFSPLEVRNWLNDVCRACRIPRCEIRPT